MNIKFTSKTFPYHIFFHCRVSLFTNNISWYIIVKNPNSYRPVSDNRASLLRSSAPTKKVPTESQKDSYLKLWRNQVACAMRLVPQIPSVAVRCASPDLSLRWVWTKPILDNSSQFIWFLINFFKLLTFFLITFIFN